jgi:hypothetical protein
MENRSRQSPPSPDVSSVASTSELAFPAHPIPAERSSQLTCAIRSNRRSFGIFARLGTSEPPRSAIRPFLPIQVKTCPKGPDIDRMMKDPALKIALAFFVLLTGFCAAMMFRREKPQSPPIVPSLADQMLIRHRANTAAPAVRPRVVERLTPAEGDPATSTSDERSAAFLKPSDRHEPPPPLAYDYPTAERPASSRWGASMDSTLPASVLTEDAKRSHKIVDGDTLASLAERFLGSASRAGEIFERNRDVLLDPNLLPIGVELKIPPRNNRPAESFAPPSAASAKPPLTPVPNLGR